MPKRPPGVYKRGSTWSVVIDHGRDPDTGKRRQVWHSGFATLSEASQARTRLLCERDTGAAIDPSRQTFAEFIRDEWLPSRAPTTGRAGRGHRGKVGIQTWDSYPGDLERHVIPRIGGIPLQKLTPSTSIGCTTSSSSPAAAPRGAGTEDHRQRPRRDPQGIWSPEQLRSFLRSVRDDRLYAMWLLFATTGMRRGEVAGLAWDDVDLVAGQVRISWTLGVVQRKPTWKPAVVSGRSRARAGRQRTGGVH